MFRLTIVEGERQGETADISQYPFVVGKNAPADLRLNDRGIWDDHVAIDLNGEKRPIIRRIGDGNVMVNQETVTRQVLRDGDAIAIGSVVLRFGVTPVFLRALSVFNALAWLLLGAVVATEIVIVRLVMEW